MKASDREYFINDDIDAYQATVKGLNIKQIKNLGISLAVAICSFVLFMLLDVPMFLISIMTITACLPVIIVLFFNIEGLSFREFATRKWQYAFREPYCYQSQTFDKIEKYLKEEDKPGGDEKKKKKLFLFALLNKERKNKRQEDMDMDEELRWEKEKSSAEAIFSSRDDKYPQEEEDIFSDEEYEEEIRKLQDFMRNNVSDVESTDEVENNEMTDNARYEEQVEIELESEEAYDTEDDYDEEDDSYRDVIGKNRIKLHLNEEEKHALFSVNKAEDSVREKIKEENHNAEFVEYSGDTEPLYFPSDSSGYELVNTKNGMHVALNRGETRIGRKRQFSDVTIENRSVSGKHAVITVRDGTITVRDVGSRNGMYIDGAKIQSDFEIIVHENSKITFSNETFIIRKV